MIGPDLSRVQHDAHSLLVEQVIFNNKILLPLYTSYIEKFYTLAATFFLSLASRCDSKRHMFVTSPLY